MNDHARTAEGRPRPYDPRRSGLSIDEDGLGFGPGAILASREPSPFGRPKIAFDRERIAALVSVAFGKPIEDRALAAIEKACDRWQAGDSALANISLAFCRLPQFGEIASLRLRFANYCLDEGLTPRALMRALDLGEGTGTLGKYDENQPRVPAGNGRPSGRPGTGECSGARSHRVADGGGQPSRRTGRLLRGDGHPIAERPAAGRRRGLRPVTREPFSIRDPQHLAVAKAIEAALVPLDRMPYPIDVPYT